MPPVPPWREARIEVGHIDARAVASLGNSLFIVNGLGHLHGVSIAETSAGNLSFTANGPRLVAPGHRTGSMTGVILTDAYDTLFCISRCGRRILRFTLQPGVNTDCSVWQGVERAGEWRRYLSLDDLAWDNNEASQPTCLVGIDSHVCDGVPYLLAMASVGGSGTGDVIFSLELDPATGDPATGATWNTVPGSNGSATSCFCATSGLHVNHVYTMDGNAEFRRSPFENCPPVLAGSTCLGANPASLHRQRLPTVRRAYGGDMTHHVYRNQCDEPVGIIIRVHGDVLCSDGLPRLLYATVGELHCVATTHFVDCS